MASEVAPLVPVLDAYVRLLLLLYTERRLLYLYYLVSRGRCSQREGQKEKTSDIGTKGVACLEKNPFLQVSQSVLIPCFLLPL